MTNLVAQGDILLRRIDAMPENIAISKRDNGRVVLAYGEATGHAHAFTEDHVTMYHANDNSNRRFLAVMEKPATLFHEEHLPIAFDPGVYEIVRQVEWGDQDEPIVVAD